jgi:hypothetical protein
MADQISQQNNSRGFQAPDYRAQPASGYAHEPFDWVRETKVAPWVIWVLGKDGGIKKASSQAT